MDIVKQPSSLITESGIREQKIQSSRLYTVFWRWHFLTGFFAVPILVIAALTGAVLTYQAELHPILYPHLDLVTPGAVQVSLDQQLEAVKTAYPHIHVHGLIVYPPDSGRSTIVRFTFHEASGNFFNPWDMGNAYVNPFTGEMLGMLDESQDIFDWITNLHKSFFLKLPGELAVDLATSWGVISLLAGLYLWWPRRKEKLWGVWLPRLKGSPRLILRDLHTVPSIYITPTAIAVMLSGVLLGLSAGPILLTTILSGQFPTQILSPKSMPASAQAQPLGLETIAARMGPQPGPEPYSIGMPSDAAGAYVIQYGSHTDAVNYRIAMVDQYSGNLILNYTAQTWPAGSRFYYLYIFNEVLHRGTYWGMLGKLLTFIACILVAVMSVTSWLMWWQRKPAGSWGIPKAVGYTSFPKWTKVAFIILSTVFMPFVGISMLMVMFSRWMIHIFKRRFSR